MTHLTSTIALRELAGGALIGGASAVLLLFNGQVAGISGIVGSLFRARGARAAGASDDGWRWAFVAGLVAGGLLLLWLLPAAFRFHTGRSLPLVAAAGLLVGVGTQLGRGCTSGHGVCGISYGSARSIAATLTFILAGAAAVFAFHLVAGRGLA